MRARVGVQRASPYRPLWVDDPEWAGFLSLDTSAAASRGLVCRPLRDTLEACLAWEEELGLDRTGRHAGLDRADELAVISRARGA